VRLPGGILLPQDVLQSPTFIAFALFVGLNTLIYLGLTLAKFAPWPPQLPPDRVRALLPPVIAKDTPMSSLDPHQRTLISEPLTTNRQGVALQTLPLGFALTGAMLLVTALLSMILGTRPGAAQYILQIIASIAMLVFAQAGFRRRLRAGALQWSWIMLMTAVIALLTYDAVVQDTTVGFAYAIVAMTALAPVVMAWRPAAVGGVVSLVIVTYGGVADYQLQGLRWAFAAIIALVIGSVLLQLRLTTVDNLTLEQLRSNTMASTDPLTGLLSKHGLMSVADTIAGTAKRLGQPVCVMVVRIVDLDTFNRAYGTAYGNTVVQTVGRALESVVREGDLVARWSGTRFVVLGLGERPDPAGFASRVQAAVRDSGIALGKTPISVTAGTASGHPDTVSLYDLEQQAQASMVPASQPAD